MLAPRGVVCVCPRSGGSPRSVPGEGGSPIVADISIHEWPNPGPVRVHWADLPRAPPSPLNKSTCHSVVRDRDAFALAESPSAIVRVVRVIAYTASSKFMMIRRSYSRSRSRTTTTNRNESHNNPSLDLCFIDRKITMTFIGNCAVRTSCPIKKSKSPTLFLPSRDSWFDTDSSRQHYKVTCLCTFSCCIIFTCNTSTPC